MSDFPPEILFDILSRLPPKDLIRFLCVSKAWNALIRHHRFIEAHLQRSIQTNSFRTILLESKDDYRPSNFFSSAFDDSETFGPVVEIELPLKCPDDYTEILGCSINGVVCVHNGMRKNLALWNPSIQKFKKIPLPTFEIELQASLYGVPEYGFGYDSANHDYKILAIVNFDWTDDATMSSQVSLYSLKFNSWKRIPKLPCDGFYVQSWDVVFLDGAMSCLMRESDSEKYRCKIVALDLASEKYMEFGTPVVDEDDNLMMSLKVLGGSLCICVHHYFANSDIWIMKEYGVTKSWTLLYSFEKGGMPHVGFGKPLVFSKNGEMVVLVYVERTTVVFRCDLKKKRAKQVRICGLPTSFDGTICAGSLSLLDGDQMTIGRQQ
ncbi:F-box protein CPR1-like [Pyrus x bretschneideri]|uniref:F-box protein CPR1-like n=1 Tax=Pyrus x bretschneideri TaxID=225117 RepID=UPI00202ED201|nr:F-box protein CPR1-like [Pyrus x bretschneideri]